MSHYYGPSLSAWSLCSAKLVQWTCSLTNFKWRHPHHPKQHAISSLGFMLLRFQLVMHKQSSAMRRASWLRSIDRDRCPSSGCTRWICKLWTTKCSFTICRASLRGVERHDLSNKRSAQLHDGEHPPTFSMRAVWQICEAIEQRSSIDRGHCRLTVIVLATWKPRRCVLCSLHRRGRQPEVVVLQLCAASSYSTVDGCYWRVKLQGSGLLMKASYWV